MKINVIDKEAIDEYVVPKLERLRKSFVHFHLHKSLKVVNLLQCVLEIESREYSQTQIKKMN